MMRLFTPFDSFIYKAPFFIFSLIFVASLNFLNLSRVPLKFALSIKELLLRFFYSLKPFFFSKGFSFWLFSMFSAIIFLNFSSVWPFIFAPTSQVRVVMFLALCFWAGIISFLIKNNTSYFMAHRVPEGTPIYLTWFLFLIEIIRNSIRPVTLTVRLVANILAGHLLIILLSNLVLGFSVAFPIYVGLNLVELFVALIQSYIFCTIICLYFSEVY